VLRVRVRHHAGLITQGVPGVLWDPLGPPPGPPWDPGTPGRWVGLRLRRCWRPRLRRAAIGRVLYVLQATWPIIDFEFHL
jgi:hypothetical protein